MWFSIAAITPPRTPTSVTPSIPDAGQMTRPPRKMRSKFDASLIGLSAPCDRVAPWTCAACLASSQTATLSRLGVELPPDQHAPDLARAGADLVEFCVAEESAQGVVVGVAVAAENLDRVERDLRRALGGVEDRAGGVLARRLAAVARLGDGVDIGARGVQRHIHVGELAWTSWNMPIGWPNCLRSWT